MPASRAESRPRPVPGPAGLALYLHWPFCLAKCPYCDFNSHVAETIDQARWRRAYLAELGHYARLLPGRRVETVYFGGGTPSLMPAETVAALLDAIASAWPLADDVEVTLEANPTSIEVGRFRDFRAAGVDRVSIGVQALDDADLAFLGRGHSAAEALAALELAGGVFPRWSFDLIYARPGQTAAAWLAELERALALGSSHISLYQLTIEQGTPFHVRWRQGGLALPGEEIEASLFELTGAATAAAGLPAYEISNHARAGEASRHNLIYWRGGAYVGVGPGAHGRLDLGSGRRAIVAHRRPERWLAAVAAQGHGIADEQALTPEEASRELLLMGLRLVEGVSLDRFAGPALAPLETVLDAEGRDRLQQAGYLEMAGGRLRVTETGRLVLNAVLGQLLL